MNNEELKCARSLARSFCYGCKALSPYLPSYYEVLEEAKKVIHEEATCPEKMVRHSKDIPIKPKGGYSWYGADVFLDPYHDHGGNLYECLRTSLWATYDAYENQREAV